MTEIYWITRLDSVCGFLTTIAVISLIILTWTSVFAICNKFGANNSEEGGEYRNSCMEDFKMYLKYSKRCAIVAIVSCLTNFFIPTTNQALLIYGVGGTIDYIKSNGTAKQLPDKCIKALDKYLDNLTKEENQKENDNESK